MKSNAEWKLWGKNDPLYGVATWPGREKSGANPWTDEDFYRLGDDWLDFRQAWQGTVGYAPGTVLEIGSGAGRITRMLSADFEKVIATDVSPDMLAYGRSRVSNPNISWTLSDGDTIPAPDESIDAVFSCQVFQHFPSTALQRDMFSEVRRVLKTGGTFFVHMSIHAFPQGVNGPFSSLARLQYKIFTRLMTLRAALRRQLMRIGFRPHMHGVSYEAFDLIRDLRNLGFSDVSIVAMTVRTGLTLHCCVSGRKS
jgi:SAM-dependent methyltransferase